MLVQPDINELGDKRLDPIENVAKKRAGPARSHLAKFQAQPASNPPAVQAVSDNSHSSRPVANIPPQVQQSISGIMLSQAAVLAGPSGAFPLDLPQDASQGRPNNGDPAESGQEFEFVEHFQIIGCEANRSGDHGFLSHARASLARNSAAPLGLEKTLQNPDKYRPEAALQPHFGLTDESEEIITTVPIGVNFYGVCLFDVVGGSKVSAALSLPLLQSAWGYLSAQEAAETNWSLRDDLRIAKLCLLEAGEGNPDPWRTAFWKYMGITPEKFQGILAERQAYAATLGKTLAQELADPAFLAQLEPLARPFYSNPQIVLEFSPPAQPPKKSSLSAGVARRKGVA